MSDPVTITLPRDAAMQILYQMMSDACEEESCASWTYGWEDFFPPHARKVASTGKRLDGRCSSVTVQQAETMCALADALGSWVKPIWNEPRFRLEAYVPTSERKGET